MGIVGVPMIHCDPVEPRSEVALRVLHELAREGAKVGHLARVLRRDCEPEMMPVLFAPFGESLRVGVVGGCVEHPGICAVAGHSVALQVGDMLRERRGTKSAASVAHDPGHDDDAPAGRSGGQGQRRPPSAAEGRASGGVPPLRLNVWPRWPAFFAARITSPTKLFGRLAPWLP